MLTNIKKTISYEQLCELNTENLIPISIKNVETSKEYELIFLDPEKNEYVFESATDASEEITLSLETLFDRSLYQITLISVVIPTKVTYE